MTTLIVSSAVTLVLGMVLGVFAGEWVRRPKVIVSGQGGGFDQATGNETHNFQLSNQHTLLGFNLGATQILGWQLHPAIQKALPVHRNSTTVTVVLRQGDYAGVNLWMRNLTRDRGLGPLSPTVEISNDEHVGVSFIELDGSTGRYWIIEPDENGDAKRRGPGYTGDRTFDLEILYGTTRRKVKAIVWQLPDGKLRMSYQ